MREKSVYVTTITVDHKLYEALVDTTVKSVATQLIRCGFKELGDAHILPYRSFVGQADQIWLRLPKGQRKVSGAARKSVEAKKPRSRTPAAVDVAA